MDGWMDSYGTGLLKGTSQLSSSSRTFSGHVPASSTGDHNECHEPRRRENKNKNPPIFLGCKSVAYFVYAKNKTLYPSDQKGGKRYYEKLKERVNCVHEENRLEANHLSGPVF